MPSIAAEYRRSELHRRRISQRSISQVVGCDFSLVCLVVKGKRLSGPKTEQVMAEIARRLDAKVEDVFPDAPVQKHYREAA